MWNPSGSTPSSNPLAGMPMFVADLEYGLVDVSFTYVCLVTRI